MRPSILHGTGSHPCELFQGKREDLVTVVGTIQSTVPGSKWLELVGAMGQERLAFDGRKLEPLSGISRVNFWHECRMGIQPYDVIVGDKRRDVGEMVDRREP